MKVTVELLSTTLNNLPLSIVNCTTDGDDNESSGSMVSDVVERVIDP